MSNYNNIVKSYLFKAIQDILKMVEKRTLRDFCIYISFDKNSTGVEFPMEVANDKHVTIVLQNRFWDLEVTSKGFHVTLEFEEKINLFVPFNSIVMFSDPEKEFCIDFRSFNEEEEDFIEETDNIITIDFKNS